MLARMASISGGLRIERSGRGRSAQERRSSGGGSGETSPPAGGVGAEVGRVDLVERQEGVHAGRLHRGDGGDADPVADQGVAEQLPGFVADRRAGARDVGWHEVGGHEEQLELRLGEQNVLVAVVAIAVAVACEGGAAERGSGDGRGGESRHGEGTTGAHRAEVTPGEHDGAVRVLFATAELAPIAAVGGLAQAAAGLVAELRRQGVDVDVVMPDYGGIELADARDPRARRAGLGRPGTCAQRRARRRRAAQRGRGARAGAISSVPSTRRPRLAGQRPTLPLVLPGDRRDRRGDPARHHPPQRLAHRRHPRRRRRLDPQRAVAAQHRLPGFHRRCLAAPPRPAGPPLRVVQRDQSAVRGDRSRRRDRRRLADPRQGDPHPGGRLRPRRRAAQSLGRRQRDPQRHRHGRVGPRDRSVARDELLGADQDRRPDDGQTARTALRCVSGRGFRTTTCRWPW